MRKSCTGSWGVQTLIICQLWSSLYQVCHRANDRGPSSRLAGPIMVSIILQMKQWCKNRRRRLCKRYFAKWMDDAKVDGEDWWPKQFGMYSAVLIRLLIPSIQAAVREGVTPCERNYAHTIYPQITPALYPGVKRDILGNNSFHIFFFLENDEVIVVTWVGPSRSCS